MNPFLSIVIPLYNEEESVKPLVKNTCKILDAAPYSYEVILVDDGSTDSTWAVIEELSLLYPQLNCIKFRKNFGQTSAMVAGFDRAKGNIIVTLDGDLQNDPSDIPKMVGKIEEGYDIVSGWRKNRRDHFSRVLPSRVANAIISYTTGVHLHDYGCSLKAYRAHCVKSLHAYGEMHRFFPALASMTGARIIEMPVNHYPRKFGTSKYGFDRIFKVISDIFSMNLIIRFSAMPLKGFSLLAAPFALLTFLFGLLAVFAMVYDWTAGKALFFFFATTLMGMATIHLVSLGIIGELVVNTSDLTHTELPELTKKDIKVTSI